MSLGHCGHLVPPSAPCRFSSHNPCQSRRCLPPVLSLQCGAPALPPALLNVRGRKEGAQKREGEILYRGSPVHLVKSQSALQILTASECTEVVGDPCILSVDPAAGSMGCLFLFGLNRGVSDAEVN